MTALTASARCLTCGPIAEGEPAPVDKAAERHTAAGHPTATTAVPQTPGTQPG